MTRSKFIPSLLYIATLFSLGSCSPKLAGSKKAKTAKTYVIYPSPPDTPRIQYLLSYSNSLDITGKQSVLQENVLGENKGLPIGKPYGIATVKGKIFVCDASLRGIIIIDLVKKDFFPFVPAGSGQMKLPINCAVSEDRLYVTDVGRNEVVIYDNQFNYLGALGKSDSIFNFKPMDVCTRDNNIWVTNPLTHQVLYYKKDTAVSARFANENVEFVRKNVKYTLYKTFPDTIPGTDEYLFNPINLSHQNGKIYVTDFGDFKVKVFTEEGEFLYTIGGLGNDLGKFVRPKGTAVDEENTLYVVDAGFENVQMFNESGQLLMHFGGPYQGPGDMWLPAKVHIEKENIDFFKKWLNPQFELKYLIYVTNQYGPDKVSIYGAVVPKQ